MYCMPNMRNMLSCTQLVGELKTIAREHLVVVGEHGEHRPVGDVLADAHVEPSMPSVNRVCTRSVGSSPVPSPAPRAVRCARSTAVGRLAPRRRRTSPGISRRRRAASRQRRSRPAAVFQRAGMIACAASSSRLPQLRASVERLRALGDVGAAARRRRACATRRLCACSQRGVVRDTVLADLVAPRVRSTGPREERNEDEAPPALQVEAVHADEAGGHQNR